MLLVNCSSLGVFVCYGFGGWLLLWMCCSLGFVVCYDCLCVGMMLVVGGFVLSVGLIVLCIGILFCCLFLFIWIG